MNPQTLLRRSLLLAFLSLALATAALAQPGRTVRMAANLKTLRTVVDGDAEKMPIIPLDGSERIEFSFDDLTHEYRRYTYRIVHCDYEGNPTDELFESDYVSAVADEEVIDDYDYSRNTTVQYTHYALTIPNAHVRPLLSGNYKLVVSAENDEGDPEPVIETYFGVVDTQVGLRPTCTTDTEIDRNAAHQQVSMRVDFGSLPLRDAASEVRTLIMQNRRADNAIANPPHTAQNGNVLIWEHSRDLIFPAGNEYRKMEILSTRYPGMHGAHVGWFAPYYHYTLFPDAPRPNYLYDEDRDGLSLVRCEGAGDADVEADYVVTHFRLEMPRRANGEVYVSGRWATTGLAPDYRMTYNEAEGAYEADILLKLGYYNYMYLCTSSAQPTRGETAPAEGDFYQTENEYEFLVYYRPTGSRYWQLVGATTPIYRK